MASCARLAASTTEFKSGHRSCEITTPCENSTKLFRPSMCLTPSAIARMAVSNSRACWRSIADRSAAYCAAMRFRAMASAAFEPAAPIPAPAEAAPAPDATDGSATPERVRADSPLLIPPLRSARSAATADPVMSLVFSAAMSVSRSSVKSVRKRRLVPRANTAIRSLGCNFSRTYFADASRTSFWFWSSTVE